MNKEINIVPPEGFEIDKDNSTFECIKFKPINKELPKTWEEFCKTHPRQDCERFIDCDSSILSVGNYSRRPLSDRNILPSIELAEAILALCQLIQLRDCYNDGWKPNWTTQEKKYIIFPRENRINTDWSWANNRILAFKTRELSDQFLENFRDLIEIAKPLL